MEAREFYDQKLEEDPTLGTVELMEMYAKHIIEINFCDGTPIEFNKCTVKQLEETNRKINLCIDWVNS